MVSVMWAIAASSPNRRLHSLPVPTCSPNPTASYQYKQTLVKTNATKNDWTSTRIHLLTTETQTRFAISIGVAIALTLSTWAAEGTACPAQIFQNLCSKWEIVNLVFKLRFSAVYIVALTLCLAIAFIPSILHALGVVVVLKEVPTRISVETRGCLARPIEQPH